MVVREEIRKPDTPRTEADPRWAAVVARDPAADGTFYYSVRTTGVYCRPSCAARPARPGNVAFHATREEAERAGFRPCLRCRPDRERREHPRAADEIGFAVGDSSLGRVLVARSGRGLCAVLLGDDRDALERDLRARFPDAALAESGGEVAALAAEVLALIESPARTLDAPLDLRGTEFQRSVWRALREIPAGETASYAGIAERIGRPQSVRAVARACGANALAVVVPCHRVVRSDGGLSGYRWGVERKRELLAKEAAA